jgi:hypothetical protein
MLVESHGLLPLLRDTPTRDSPGVEPGLSLDPDIGALSSRAVCPIDMVISGIRPIAVARRICYMGLRAPFGVIFGGIGEASFGGILGGIRKATAIR